MDGVEIHLIHERGKGPDPTPLLLLHGWPDSFYRYHKVISFLTDPASFGGDPNTTFDVIVPSIPGHGFSERRALSSAAVADLFATLMTEVLGYQHFVAAGGDLGTLIAQALANSHPERLVAIHLTDAGYPDQTTDHSTLTPPELEFAQYIQGWFFTEGAFNMIQSTKPQSLAYGLNDSPAGLAAWIMSFVCIGTTGEESEKRFSRDELLTNIMIYWVTETINSSIRMYYENVRMSPPLKAGQHIEVPAGVALFPKDLFLPPREWAERSLRIQRWTQMPRGGHFAALEEPELLVEDLRAFYRSSR